MQFRVFSKAKVQNGIFLGVAKILIFFWVFEIPDIFC